MEHTEHRQQAQGKQSRHDPELPPLLQPLYVAELHLNGIAAGAQRGGGQPRQTHQGQGQQGRKEISHWDLKSGAEKQILRIAHRHGHAAQVGRHGLEDNEIDALPGPTDQPQHQDSKRHKRDERDIVGDEHGAEKGQQHQNQSQQAEALASRQQPLGQNGEHAAVLRPGHHQHQAEQQA